jgi:putative integral membrane protein (TIGR02587 family)
LIFGGKPRVHVVQIRFYRTLNVDMQFSPRSTPSQSLREYGRGVTGGLIFALPLLFTMEVWWASFILSSGRLWFYVLASFAVLVIYNRFTGLRSSANWWECAIDSVEELGIGIVVSAALLWTFGRLDESQSALESLCKIILEGMTVALGVSVGTAQLGAGDNDPSGMEKEGADNFASHIGLAFCGALLLAANIAPTEEILLIAEESSPERLLLIAFLSLAMGGYILFFAEFRGSSRAMREKNGVQIVRGAISAYAIALFASAGALFFFGRFEGESLRLCVSQTVVVSFAASLGASAGRYLLQSGSGQNSQEQNNGAQNHE